MVDFSLNDKQGVIQHKTAIAKHIINDSFNGKELYEHWKTRVGIDYVQAIDANTDLRVLNEMRALYAYCLSFGVDIASIQVNLDQRAGSFHAQKQTNQDFWINFKPEAIKIINNVASYSVQRSGNIQQDEKSGQGMFTNATRGTIGLLSYDEKTNENIQIMSKCYSLEDVIEKDVENARMIIEGLKHDKTPDIELQQSMLEAVKILKQTNKPLVEIHNEYQKYIWDHIQTNPSYTRSTSFVFIATIAQEIQSDPQKAFATKMYDLLGDRVFNLDKRGDCRQLSLAMLRAYYLTVDKKIVQHIERLRHEGKIELNRKFVEDFSSYIKDHGNVIHTFTS